MPTAHRLACFRDDIVFIIYLYQRWYVFTEVLLVTVAVVVVVVVVIAQQLVSYRQLSRLRKSATMAGLSHKPCTVSCKRWL